MNTVLINIAGMGCYCFYHLLVLAFRKEKITVFICGIFL